MRWKRMARFHALESHATSHALESHATSHALESHATSHALESHATWKRMVLGIEWYMEAYGADHSSQYLSICDSITFRLESQKSFVFTSIPNRPASIATLPSPVLLRRSLYLGMKSAPSSR